MEAGIACRGRPFRVGLVGLGKIARDRHVPAILADPAFDLIATASPDGELADVPGYADMDSMLAAGHDLDAVILCTPPGIRAQLAAKALSSGMHLMLEKPPAARASEATPLERLARENGRSVFAAWHSREAAAVSTSRAWLQERSIREVRVIWRESIYRWHPGQTWLVSAGGFGVFDPAINAFSILTRILPETLAVVSADLFIPVNCASPVAAKVTMRCGEAPVSCDLSILETGRQQWDIEVCTDKGTLVLTDGGAVCSSDGQGFQQDGQSSADGEYPRLYQQFAGLIASGTSDFDLGPLKLVDAVLDCGTIHHVAEFAFT
ncbi:Gfo/Idh/MocA family oxidoreductase [Novosphingobium flavum]|uniref:Gfo/Idh/MocA family oxidoreductase n=1 Tax=Novosphingobium aerophilum TaxID=2839843 RepID=A0A7X1KCR7_9SPHN|nr:Gfo/Idh/MocA family oxidoreductase [Novosphingobium aerophilum]MBC2652387.1 Gfo/Idh/MocA family oxidoreductase [Novosphingobium aerophilum]MBC2662340.1 Gfo/Idh/MocA family oxidoreductase [Novosphingobium aerophilum]